MSVSLPWSESVNLIPTKACQLFSFWRCAPENIYRLNRNIWIMASVSSPCADPLELITLPLLPPTLPHLTSLCAPSSLCSLLWPSPRISPKLWAQGSCPTPWLLLQQWPLQHPRIHWLSVQQLLHPTHTITYCKARLSATPSWDPRPGPSAPHTGRSSSPRTDTPPSDFVQSGTATPKAHCEDTNIINKQQLIGDKYPII